MAAPPGGGGQACGEAAWVGQMGEMSARRPDRDIGLGKHVIQPVLVVGSELATSDEQVRHRSGAQGGQLGGGVLGELGGRSVQQFPQVADHQVLPHVAGRPE